MPVHIFPLISIASAAGRAAARLCRLVAICFCLGTASVAHAGGDPGAAGAVTAELLPGWRTGPGRHLAGLRLRLAPGWKTYWRSAGSAGISPQFDWRGSQGIADVETIWPSPGFFEGPAGLAVGYGGDVVLPLDLRIDGASPVLRGKVDIGVCREICIPVRLKLEVPIPAQGARDRAISDAMGRRILRSRVRAECGFRPASAGLGLTASVSMAPLGPVEAVVFEVDDPTIWVTDAEVLRQGDTLRADASLIGQGGGPPAAVRRAGIRITVMGEGQAVELAGCAG